MTAVEMRQQRTAVAVGMFDDAVDRIKEHQPETLRTLGLGCQHLGQAIESLVRETGEM